MAQKVTNVTVRLAPFIMMLGILLATWFFFVPGLETRSASYTWDGGGADNNWSTCANWSDDTCPSASDIAIFDGTSAKDATVDGGFAGTVSGLDVQAGYTGILTLAANLEIGTDDFTIGGGTTNLGSATLTLNGADVIATGGAFLAATSTVIFNGTTSTIDVPTLTILNNVTINKLNPAQDLIISAGDTVVVTGTLTITGYGEINGPGVIEMRGANTIIDTNGPAGDSVIQYLVAGNQTITASGGSIPGILVNKAGDALTQSGSYQVHDGDFTMQAGTYDAGAGTLELDGADFTMSGGTFTANTSTISFTGTAATFDVPTSLNLNNVLFAKNNAATPQTIATGDTMIVTGTLTVNGNGPINGPGVIEMRGATTTVGSSAASGDSVIQYLVAGNQTINASGGGLPGVLINKPSDTVTQTGSYEIRDGNFTLQSGTYDAGSGTLTLRGADFTKTGGTFTANTGTVEFTFTAATIDVDTNITFNNLTFAKNNAATPQTIASGDTLIVTGTLTFNGNGPVNGPGVIEMRGATTATDAAGATGDAVVQYLVAGDQTIGGFAGYIPGVLINKPSGTLTQTGSYTVHNGNFTLQSGTYDAGSTVLNLWNADLIIAGGTFNANTGTVGFQGTSATIDVDSTVTLNNVIFNKLNLAQTDTIAAGDTIIVNGTLLFDNGVTNGPGVIEMRGSSTTVSGHHGGTVAITYAGGAEQTYELTSGDEPDGDVTVNKSGGSLTLNSDYNANEPGDQDFSLTAGTVKLAGNNLRSTGVVTFGANTIIQVHGTETIQANGGAVADSTALALVTGDEDGLADIIDLGSSFYPARLTINSTDGALDVFTLTGGDLTVASNFTLTNGELQLGTSTMNVAGNWSRTGGSFTPGTGTVNLNGTNQSFSGDTTFYNLTKTVSSADTLTFTNGSTQTVTNTMTLQGASGELLSLRSDSVGDQWNIDPQGTRTISYLDVQDSNNTNATIIAVDGFNITNSGNNTNWAFNSAPAISVDPSDGGSNGASPTNAGNIVTFTATANDAQGDQYYLAICKTNAITPQNDAPPTCDGGSWAVSAATNGTEQATVAYTSLAGDAESNDWYAFACDKTTVVPLCSSVSQGSGSNGSPFSVNHEPTFSALSAPNSVDVLNTVTFSTTSSDSDIDTTTDTLRLFVCKSNDATNAGCGGGGTWCSDTSSTDASCSFTTTVNEGNTTHSYYAYIFDSHGFASSNNPRLGNYSVVGPSGAGAPGGGSSGPSTPPPPPPPPPDNPVVPPPDDTTPPPPPNDSTDPPDDPMAPPPDDPATPPDDSVTPPSDPTTPPPTPPNPTPPNPPTPSPGASGGSSSNSGSPGAGTPPAPSNPQPAPIEPQPEPTPPTQSPTVESVRQDKKSTTESIKKAIETVVPKPIVNIATEAVEQLEEIVELSEPAAKPIAAAGLAGGVASTAPSLFAGVPLANLPLLLRQWWNLVLAALGLRRRKPWGTVFDSVTKQPLDPVVVKLKNAAGKVVETSVTDMDGRYGFLIKPGNYTIDVNKTHYKFPPDKQSIQTTEIYDNLYFGNRFMVNKAGVASKNIPMDPIGFDWNEEAKRGLEGRMHYFTKRYRWFRIMADVLFAGGLVYSIAQLIFDPSIFSFGLVLVYLLITLLRRLGLSPRAFGHLTDTNGKPLSFALVRVYYKGLDQEIRHVVADRLGRYYCLVENGEYTVKIFKRKRNGDYEEIKTTDVTAKRGIINDALVV